MMKEVTYKKILSVHFSLAVFSLLDFFTLEDGNNSLSQNVGKDLLFYAAQYLRRAKFSHDLAMRA